MRDLTQTQRERAAGAEKLQDLYLACLYQGSSDSCSGQDQELGTRFVCFLKQPDVEMSNEIKQLLQKDQFHSSSGSQSYFSLKSTLGYNSSFWSSAPAFTLAQASQEPSCNQVVPCSHLSGSLHNYSSTTEHDLGVLGPAVSDMKQQ